MLQGWTEGAFWASAEGVKKFGLRPKAEAEGAKLEN